MKQKIPRHVAIILDGNRRWAKREGLPSFEGHREGLRNAERIARFAFKQGVEVLTVYALSLENLKRRSRQELDFLFLLFDQAFEDFLPKFHRENIRVRFIGDLSLLPMSIQEKAKRIEGETKNNTSGTFVIALAYDGQDEIVRAAQKILRARRTGEVRSWQVDKHEIEQRLDTAGLPPVDLLIRTSGEKRISSFLLWQASYAELHFSSKFWPEFSEKDFLQAIEEYAIRERRFGE